METTSHKKNDLKKFPTKLKSLPSLYHRIALLTTIIEKEENEDYTDKYGELWGLENVFPLLHKFYFILQRIGLLFCLNIYYSRIVYRNLEGQVGLVEPTQTGSPLPPSFLPSPFPQNSPLRVSINK